MTNLLNKHKLQRLLNWSLSLLYKLTLHEVNNYGL
nr:MAG TPA: hypothetical protein [Caudoviricetes sp.]DAS89423.1 MAG TPA: hypothetical protein [Bacteriophage sp.]